MCSCVRMQDWISLEGVDGRLTFGECVVAKLDLDECSSTLSTPLSEGLYVEVKLFLCNIRAMAGSMYMFGS